MTEAEEALFRAAARKALGLSQDIVMVQNNGQQSEPPDFSVVTFENHPFVAIVLPGSWTATEGIEDRCHAILRQESKALAGQALD